MEWWRCIRRTHTSINILGQLVPRASEHLASKVAGSWPDTGWVLAGSWVVGVPFPASWLHFVMSRLQFPASQLKLQASGVNFQNSRSGCLISAMNSSFHCSFVAICQCVFHAPSEPFAPPFDACFLHGSSSIFHAHSRWDNLLGHAFYCRNHMVTSF